VQATLLGEAVDAAELAILVSDEEGRCIAVNEQACALLGYTREQLLTLEVRDFAPDTDVQECFRVVQELGTGEGIANAVRSDGSRLAVRYWSTPTRVAQMRLVVSLGRPEPDPAAAA
jgi:PAS domain S-box-containing protein